MKLYEIDKKTKAQQGEYLFHAPSQQVVVCGQFNVEENYIQALGDGRIFKDVIENFKKIELARSEHETRMSTRCKGCRGRK
tara:strand:+ start:153 stop:395 length:243 start_codon:yes stop_codon:yes gene_type:complete